MYNLIVEGGTANPRQGALHRSRVFEYTQDELLTYYKPDGIVDIPKVLALPTLFMEEGLGNEVARIGWLSRIEQKGSEYHFQYQFDPDIPSLTNSEISEMAGELEISDWEFSRNHWAIKQADLPFTLLKNRFSNAPKPTVFQLSNNPVNPRLVSLMMPFTNDFDQVYAKLRSAINALGCECQRADDFWLHQHIMQDIIELICTSNVVIFDLSQKNPNVFYEAGIAHTLGKEVILITQSMEDVPFDLRAIRCVTYLNNGEGLDRLAADVSARLVAIMR